MGEREFCVQGGVGGNSRRGGGVGGVWISGCFPLRFIQLQALGDCFSISQISNPRLILKYGTQR